MDLARRQQRLTAAIAALAVLAGTLDVRAAVGSCDRDGCCAGCERAVEESPEKSCCSKQAVVPQATIRTCGCSHLPLPLNTEGDRPRLKTDSLPTGVMSSAVCVRVLFASGEGRDNPSPPDAAIVALPVLHCTWLI